MSILLNDEGLKAIRIFLRGNLKKGSCTFSQVCAWAIEAETHFEENGEAFIELKSWETLSGANVVLRLSSSCYDICDQK